MRRGKGLEAFASRVEEQAERTFATQAATGRAPWQREMVGMNLGGRTVAELMAQLETLYQARYHRPPTPDEHRLWGTNGPAYTRARDRAWDAYLSDWD